MTKKQILGVQESVFFKEYFGKLPDLGCWIYKFKVNPTL